MGVIALVRLFIIFIIFQPVFSVNVNLIGWGPDRQILDYKSVVFSRCDADGGRPVASRPICLLIFFSSLKIHINLGFLEILPQPPASSGLISDPGYGPGGGGGGGVEGVMVPATGLLFLLVVFSRCDAGAGRGRGGGGVIVPDTGL